MAEAELAFAILQIVGSDAKLEQFSKDAQPMFHS